MNRRRFLSLALLTLGGCAIPPSLIVRPDPTRTPDPLHPVSICQDPPLTAPPLPATTPGPDLLDVTTGLHVKNYQALQIDPASYRLKVSGLVDNPQVLSLTDLCGMPRLTSKVICTCPDYFEDVTYYTGVPLTYVLGLASVQKNAKEVDMTGADGVTSYLDLQDAVKEENFLAYQWKSQPLPAQNGFPLRAVIPSKHGFNWTKYLLEIRLV
jgi:DMSO/TMAO reductase YedYZ molybdopterin-dependent catalytic subunit